MQQFRLASALDLNHTPGKDSGSAPMRKSRPMPVQIMHVPCCLFEEMTQTLVPVPVQILL